MDVAWKESTLKCLPPGPPYFRKMAPVLPAPPPRRGSRISVRGERGVIQKVAPSGRAVGATQLRGRGRPSAPWIRA